MAMPIVPAIVALSIWSGGLLQELSQISTEVCCTPRRRYLQHRWRLNSVCRRMTTIRRFTCDDLFTFNRVNLDYFTETVRAALRAGHPAILNSSAMCP